MFDLAEKELHQLVEIAAQGLKTFLVRHRVIAYLYCIKVVAELEKNVQLQMNAFLADFKAVGNAVSSGIRRNPLTQLSLGKLLLNLMLFV